MVVIFPWRWFLQRCQLTTGPELGCASALVRPVICTSQLRALHWGRGERGLYNNTYYYCPGAIPDLLNHKLGVGLPSCFNKTCRGFSNTLNFKDYWAGPCPRLDDRERKKGVFKEY